MLDFFAAIRDVFVQHDFFVGNEHGMKIRQVVAELEGVGCRYLKYSEVWAVDGMGVVDVEVYFCLIEKSTHFFEIRHAAVRIKIR